MKPKWKEFGKLLKEERRRNKISRIELAIGVGREASTIASWEQGYRRPKQQSFLDLSRILGTPIQQLQAKAGHTPEFNWYTSLTAQLGTEQDILLSATDKEKEELRKYLHYLRFERQVIAATLHPS